jgi:hypothetical protein
VPDDLVYAATAWPTNAALIVDCHRLGYLKDTDHILDPTYGRGTWWRLWRPFHVTKADLHAFQGVYPAYDVYPVDFRGGNAPDLTWADEFFDAVAFDPPYVSVGGRSTSGINGMHAAYGMDGTPTSPDLVQRDINLGLKECFRVVKKGGIVLVKCQSYISSGKLFPGVWHTQNEAFRIGFRLVDHLIHVSGARPQPPHTRQVHSRRNHSDLLVLRRPRR